MFFKKFTNQLCSKEGCDKQNARALNIRPTP